MYSQLCDRCLTCAHEILMKYDFKTEFETEKESIDHIKFLLKCINERWEPLGVNYEVEQLNYSFLLDKCQNCVKIGERTSMHGIIVYLKVFITNEVFKCVIENNFSNDLLSDNNFLEVIKNKLITFHISTIENEVMIYYYNQSLINYYDFKIIPYFKELDNLPIYFKQIYKVPIYLANIRKDDYLQRDNLNLKDKIIKHSLCFKEE